MKKSLPYLTSLAACIVAAAAWADSEPPLPPGQGGAETAYSIAGTSTTATSEGASPANADIPATLSPVAESVASQIAPGNELLVKAAGQLERRASVTARMRHQVALEGQQLYGVGSYWQQGSGEALKVRLELQIAGEEA